MACEPLDIIWDNIQKAQFFLEKAKQWSDIPLKWCLENVASGLWAAVTVLNNGVLPSKGIPPIRRGKWFRQNGKAVWMIRNAVEHFSFEYGVGQSFSPRPEAPTDEQGIAWHTAGDRGDEGTSVHTFVWGLGPTERPVDEVLTELEETHRRVRELVWSHTGDERIHFHTETRPPLP